MSESHTHKGGSPWPAWIKVLMVASLVLLLLIYPTILFGGYGVLNFS